MKDNILFTVTNIDLISRIKDMGIKRLVFPLFSFCVGIPNTFKIDEIKEENAYILVNRVLDTKAIDELDIILHNLPSNIKGIIFDDLGVIDICKDLSLEKILFLSHFNTNFESINIYFNYVDEVIVSTDITEKEIDEIIDKTDKRVSLFVFGLVSAMYSRRHLISCFDKHYHLLIEDKKDLYIDDHKFISIENDYGTVIYNLPYYNGLRLLNKNAKYYFYFPILLKDNQIIDLINNDISNINCNEGFLDTETIYKIKKEAK